MGISFSSKFTDPMKSSLRIAINTAGNADEMAARRRKHS